MIIDKNNYEAVLTEMILSETSFIPYKDELLFTVGEQTIHYYPDRSYLKAKHYNNDYIFNALGLDPDTFCEKVYGYIPQPGIFPEINQSRPMDLVKVAYALFQACDGLKPGENIKEVPLNTVKSNFLSGLTKNLQKLEIEFPF